MASAANTPVWTDCSTCDRSHQRVDLPGMPVDLRCDHCKRDLATSNPAVLAAHLAQKTQTRPAIKK